MLKQKRVELNEEDILYYGGLKHGGLDYLLDEHVKDPSSTTGFSFELNGFASDARPDEVVTKDELVKRVVWTLIAEGEIEDLDWTGEFIPRASIVPGDKEADDLEYLWKLVLTVSA